MATKFYFHHLEDGPNIAKGSSSLRILGEKMSPVDFLVREAIQNSSDACYRERKDGKTFVCVDFDTGSFYSRAFNSLLDPKVADVLNRRFKDAAYKWIAISDFNCEGLNGAVRPEDPTVRSNFCRLICDSGEAQDKEGSGGCWGYGKSVYYRIGIGIVIFYSRFKDDDGSYRSRLIIKLAEDEKSPNAILRNAGYAKSAGIAWWCRDVKDGWLLPVEDEDEISEVLKIFGIDKYQDEKDSEHGDAELTGTKIIIPYFDPDKVCADLLPKLEDETSLSSDQKKQVASLVRDIPSALRFATLRWYSSRLGNSWLREYNRVEMRHRARIPMLKVRVQGEPVNVDHNAPDFFWAVQDLYNKALFEAAKCYWPKERLKEPRSTVLKSVSCAECAIRNYITPTRAGWIVHAVFKPENAASPNPYILTNKYSTIAGENPPMLFFMREPGMVIDYSIGDEWLKNVGSADKNDEFVIALFYPNVKAFLTPVVVDDFPKFREHPNLGYYLRSCEEAEHSTWTEPSGLRIVERIRINCAAKLAKVYSKTVEATGGASGLLANYLSHRLMRPPKKKTGESDVPGSKHSSIRILDADATTPGRILIRYKLHLVKGDPCVRCSLLLLLDSGHVDGNHWEREDSQYDGDFPLRMTSFVVEQVEKKGIVSEVNEDLLNPSSAGIDVEYSANAHCVVFGDGVRDSDVDMEGNIEVETDNQMYKFKFGIKCEDAND